MPTVYDTLLDQQQQDASQEPQAPQASVYDKLLDTQQQAEQAATGIVLNRVMGAPADKAARAQELAKSTRLPLDVVERNFEEVDRRDQARRLQDAMAFSPVLRRQMTDPQFAALAHDDAEPLGNIERALAPAVSTMRAIPAGLQKFATNVVYGTPELLARAGSEYLGQYLAGTVLPEDPFARVAAGFSEARKGGLAFGDQIAGAAPQGFVASSIVSGGESFGRMLPGLVMSVITKNPAFAIGAGALDAGVTSATKGLDKGLSASQALAYGAQDAVAEAVTERLPMGKLIGDLKAGAPFWKLLRNQIATEVPTELAATAWQNFNEWANLNPDQPFSSYLKDLPAAEAQTVIATITTTALTAGLAQGARRITDRATIQEAKAQAAEQHARQLEALATFAAASKLAARAPDTFEQFIAQAADGGPAQQVFIDAGALMQSGVAEQIAAASPSVAEQLDAAVATGGQIAIPVEEFAARIAPTEYAQGLLDHLKTDPEGFSRAEAQVYLQTQQDTLTAEFERAAAQQESDDAFRASADVVRANVKSQLDAAGRFNSQANEAYSTLVGSMYAVQAARLGTTPEALYQRYPLRVAAEGVTGGTVLSQDDIQPVASLTGEEIAPRDADIKTLRSQAKAWYAGNLNGKTVVNKGSGREVQFRNANKAFHTSANPVKLRLFAALRDLVAGGQIINSVPPIDPSREQNVKAYHWLEGDVMLDGQLQRVGMTLREDDKGNLYYNHNPIPSGNEKGLQAGDRAAPAHKAGGVSSDETLEQSVDQNGGNLNQKAVTSLTRSDPAHKAGAGENEGTASGQSLPSVDGAVNLYVLDQPARGTFSPSTLTISLLRDADLSTFLHETGHFFMEVQADLAGQTDAPEAIRQDMQTVLDWFGVPDLAAWQAMDLEQKRPYHEQFARGFEAYLFEGKAPSIELHGLFQRFRAWLLNVYKKLSALNVTLSDDVRGVFDRMLATGEQIDLSEQGRSMLPLFETAEQAGMTQEEFAAYQALGVDATADAIEDLQTRGLRDMQWLHNARGRELKRLQKEAAARRAEVRAQVAEEVEAQPVYRAWRYLTAKAEGDTPPPRLSRAVLDEMYGGAVDGKRDRYALLDWKRLTDLRMTADEGLPPDIVAELHGFSSGDELVHALLTAERPEVEIDTRTDARMLEQYGDIASPEALARAADEAIHNEARARFTATEANALARATGQRKILLDAAREFARATVSRLRVRNVRPGQYANAEARAAQNAERAMKAGDLARAAAEKRNQVVQQQLTRAAYNARGDIDKALRYLKKFDSAGVRKNLDADYLDQIDAMLERFDLRQRSDVERARAASLRTWVQSRLNAGEIPDIAETLLSPAERARYLTAVQSRDANGDLVYADDEDAIKLLADAIDNSAQRHYRDLTVEELMGLRDTISGIEHLARLKHRLLTAAGDRDYEAVRDEIAASIATHASASGKNTRTASSLAGRALEAVRAFGAEHIKASTWARVMDGGRDDGPVWRYLIRPANEAANRETQMKADLVQRLDAIMRPILDSVPAADKVGKGRSFPQIGDSLNWQERFAVALNVGNESNLQRLLDGRGWTMAQIQPVLESLTAQELQAVQAVWDLFETYRPQIAEQERRIYGKDPDWVQPRPITIRSADGQAVRLAGGYYPVKFDPRVNLQAGQHNAAEEAKTKAKAAYGVATTRRSFTKARVEEVKGRPLLLNLQGMYSGFSDVIHGLAWQEWVIDANKLLRSKTIDTAIREHYGPEVKHELERWRDDIVVGASRQNTAAERTVNFLRQHVSAAALSFQVFTAAMQPLGLANSVARVGGSWIAKGVGRYIGAPVASTREAMSKSAFLANRTRTRFRELNELRNQVQGQSSAKEFMGRWGYWLMMRTQMMIDVPTWWGAYEKAMADGRTEDTAVALADQAVKDAQGGGEEVDQAGIERGGPYHKLLTAFYSYMGSTLNTMYASAKVDSKGKAAANILLMVLVPAVLQSLLKHAMTPGDDDWDDWLKSLPAEIASFMAGLMVVVRELDPFVKAVAGESSMGYGGPAGLRMIGDIGRLGQQINQGEFDLAFGKAFINVLGDLTGLPSVQINRTLTGVDALASGRTQNPAALLMGVQR